MLAKKHIFFGEEKYFSVAKRRRRLFFLSAKHWRKKYFLSVKHHRRKIFFIDDELNITQEKYF
jgi:hypothetical protein